MYLGHPQGMCLGNRVTGPSADYDQDVAMALAGEMFISRSSVFEHTDELRKVGYPLEV